jgi:hypothetical protein
MARALAALALAALALAPCASAFMVLVGSQGAPADVFNSSLFELDPLSGTLSPRGSVSLGVSSATWMVWRRDQTMLYVGGQCTAANAAAGLCAGPAAGGADGYGAALRLNVPARSLALDSTCALRDGAGLPAGGNVPVAIGLHPQESAVVSTSYATGVVQTCAVAPGGGVAPAPATSAFLGTHVHDVVWSPPPPDGGLPWAYLPTLGDDTVRYGRAAPNGGLALRRDSLFLPRCLSRSTHPRRTAGTRRPCRGRALLLPSGRVRARFRWRPFVDSVKIRVSRDAEKDL